MAEDWLADVRKYAPDADEAVVGKIVRYLGIALRNRDSSLVSFSDAKETGRVRGNFLKKKLGLTQSDEVLNAAIAAVGERMKGDRTKNRVTVYYLLADYFDALEIFGGVKHSRVLGLLPAARVKKAAAAKTATKPVAANPAAKAKISETKAAQPKAAAAKARAAKPASAETAPKVAVSKPKAATGSAAKTAAGKVAPVSEAIADPAATPLPPPAPPISPDAGASGVLASANLGNADRGGTGTDTGNPPPSGSWKWWLLALLVLVLVVAYMFMQSRRTETPPEAVLGTNLATGFNGIDEPGSEDAGTDNALDNALANGGT